MRSRRSYGAPVAAMGHRLYNFTSGSLPPGATLTRASTGWYFDSAGVLQSAADDVARFNYNPSTLALEGLLVEPARTNGIRNNTMVGAIAGTPGTAPTNWLITGVLNNVSHTILGTGTENGINYIDVKFAGTPNATSTRGVATDTTTAIAAAVGQTWESSVFVRVVDGSLANVADLRLHTSERNSGGTAVASGFSLFTPGAGALGTQRFLYERTLTNALAAYVLQTVVLSYTDEQAIDVTLRIALPQMEQGSGASSPIKTSSAAVARAADVLSLAMVDGTYDIDITRLSGVTNVVGAVVSGGSYTVPTDLSPLQSVVARRVA